MTITIRQNPAAFELGGQFYGKDPKYTKIAIDTGHFENWAGKLGDVYGADHPSWGGGSTAMMIDRTGVQISNYQLEACMKNESLYTTFGGQILKFHAQGLILVEADNVALTTAQIKNYTAP